MTSRDFAFWLQGFFEITSGDRNTIAISQVQADLIRKHLALVFKHEIDPSMGDAAHQAELNAIHPGKITIPAGSGVTITDVTLTPGMFNSDPNLKIRC